MAIFSKKKKEEEVKAVAKPAVKAAKAEKTAEKKPRAKKAAVAASAPKASSSKSENQADHSSILSRPRVTEKASLMAESSNVYVFEVSKSANKEMIYRAVADLYKVKPRKVAIAQTPSKNVFSRGKSGVQTGVKKAYVYLNKGDKIELI